MRAIAHWFCSRMAARALLRFLESPSTGLVAYRRWAARRNRYAFNRSTT